MNASNPRARAVGINHVALEVGDVDAALDFYGRFVPLRREGAAPGAAGASVPPDPRSRSS